MLYYIILYYTVLYYTIVLNYTALYYIVLHYVILYVNIRQHNIPDSLLTLSRQHGRNVTIGSWLEAGQLPEPSRPLVWSPLSGLRECLIRDPLHHMGVLPNIPDQIKDTRLRDG